MKITLILLTLLAGNIANLNSEIQLEDNTIVAIFVNIKDQKCWASYRLCDSVNTKLKSGVRIELYYRLSDSLRTEALKKVKEKEGLQ